MTEVCPWVVYCLSTIDSSATYIGATVDPDRRLRQHNGEISGGARATGRRPGEWQRICYVSGFKDKHEALSFEWHWKRASKGAGGPLERRKKGLDTLLKGDGKSHLAVVYE